MPITVNAAFSEFMKNSVNLDPQITQQARVSRDNLLSNIDEFSDSDDFFNLSSDFNLHYGSFSRKTKCRELDDIDLMIGISANGATYNSSQTWNEITMCASETNKCQIECIDDLGLLNSIKVLNRFKKKLSNLRDYCRSDIKRNNEAIVLNLTSKEWSFDIVPCFYTTTESNGRNYYLIPNGKGGWKKTDPRIDCESVKQANTQSNGRLLELIRLVKYWNQITWGCDIPSYVLEVMLINYSKNTTLSEYIDFRFRDALYYIYNNITNNVDDPKAIQGNINDLSYDSRSAFRQKIYDSYLTACEAIRIEIEDKNQEKSINKWKEIFKNEFPSYSV